MIKKIYLTVIEFSKFRFGFIDFQKPFENDKPGEIQLHQYKEKNTYKKFYMN